MQLDSRIFVAGHRGLVGSAILRGLQASGYSNVLLRTRGELDLLDAVAVSAFFAKEEPEFVFLAAARVGGILANDTCPADFLRENLVIQTNVIEASRQTGVKRLLFLGSSCIYPKLAPQPMPESCLLTGPLEPTNRAYALAKIAGIEMCWAYNRQYGTRYLAAMPTNLYGPGDNFDLATSHVLPALMRKTADAMKAGESKIIVWGSGEPRREFLYSDDVAEACLFLMNLDEERFGSLLTGDAPPLINVGTGKDVTIRELAEIVGRVMGFEGELVFDTSKPDGTPRKLMDVGRLHALGWRHTTELEQGVARTWELVRQSWFLKAISSYRNQYQPEEFMFKMRSIAMAAMLLAVPCTSLCGVHAQVVVKHLQPNEKSPIANGVWAGDTLYLSGQLASPVTPADPAKNEPAVYGDTKTQAFSALTKIQTLLKEQGLDMKDVVKMTVFLAGDPALGNKLDFAGLQASYTQFFGTKDQPNKPARSAMQVAALAAPWALVEIEVIAVKGR